MKKTSLHPRQILIATAATGLSLAATLALADPMQEIVVEAAAPVHSQPTGQSPPGGASVDLLSVRYHVHLGNLDLTKHADVVALEEKIKEAAKKGCKDIKNQYPLRPMSDEDSCVTAAVSSAMVKAREAIAAADKKSSK
jgi:UrcA family protein